MESHYFLEKALRSLSKSEHTRFEKFLCSPYFFKKHSDIHISEIFYKYLKKYLHKKQITEADYKKIVLCIYPRNESEWKQILSRLKYDLLWCYNKFIAHDDLENDRFLYFLSVLNQLEEKKQVDFFQHYCQPPRFIRSDSKYNETESSYYYWKLFQLANKHREKWPFSDKKPRYKKQKINRGILYTRIITSPEDRWLDPPDYDTEKMLLRKYFKKELQELQKRHEEHNAGKGNQGKVNGRK